MHMARCHGKNTTDGGEGRLAKVRRLGGAIGRAFKHALGQGDGSLTKNGGITFQKTTTV